MHKALQGRDVIGQAKGILMAEQNVSADDAFDILRRASQRMNIKLRELAERVTSRTPPDEPGVA
ncbi:MAG: ANTAR domain-containing protein [Actinobacteria bacterium]|nr:ANTAR domain-containing protein [Actinomycetota bacterium]